MDEQQSAAYLMAQAACLFAEAAGMVAENMQRQTLGHSMAYVADDFDALIARYPCHHNAACEMLRQG